MTLQEADLLYFRPLNREPELACRAMAPRRRKRPSRVADSDLLAVSVISLEIA